MSPIITQNKWQNGINNSSKINTKMVPIIPQNNSKMASIIEILAPFLPFIPCMGYILCHLSIWKKRVFYPIKFSLYYYMVFKKCLLEVCIVLHNMSMSNVAVELVLREFIMIRSCNQTDYQSTKKVFHYFLIKFCGT